MPGLVDDHKSIDGGFMAAYVVHMKWSGDVKGANWWVERLQPFTRHCVGSLIPSGFESAARIFHPIEIDDEHRSWADLAAANGRTVHSTMQLHRITSRLGDNRDFQEVPLVDFGSLPDDPMNQLANVLEATGSTGSVWFGFTDINSKFNNDSNADVPKVGTPSRMYWLLQSRLADLTEAVRFANGDTFHPDGPTLWWPDDQSWFVAGDVDLCSTYIGASRALVDQIIGTAGLEVVRAGYDDLITFDSDVVNEA